MVVRVGVRHAPVQIVVARGPIHGLFALVEVALAITAAHLSATVVVRDDVVALIGGVVGGGRSRKRRRGPPRGGGSSGAPPARAKKNLPGGGIPIGSTVLVITCPLFLLLLFP